MSKAFITLLRTTMLIAAIITSAMPTLFVQTDDSYPSDVYASDDRSDKSEGIPADSSGDDDSSSLLRQGAFNCAISIDPIVLHGDDPLPTTKIVPTGGSIASAGFFDVSYPAPDGHNEEVSVGDTLVLYLYFRNTTNNSNEQPCLSGGPVTLNISGINIFKDGAPLAVDALNSMVWPGAQGTLLAGEDTYGLIPFEVAITDDQFNISAQILYSCTGAAYCTGNFNKSISYPSPDIRTLGGVRYFDVYGRNPIINVVGPRAQVVVTSPTAGLLVAPYSVVRYVIELTSFSDQAIDDIVSITDLPGGAIPQCRSDTFNSPPQLPYGWSEDANGNERIDSSDLTGPNGPDGPAPAAIGALGMNETVYCVFDVVMDPAIINDPVSSSFTLNGTLVISNGNQTTEVEVSAEPVVILEASVSVSKTIVDPVNPVDGVPIGGTVRYRITITNTGEINLDAISLVDSLVGPVPYAGGTLVPNATFSLEIPYTVEFDDPSPLVNTVSVLAHPEGAPGNFFVEDTSATSIAIQGSEISVELKVFSVAPAGNPAAGSVLTYRIEYCNNSSGQFSNLQFVTGFPSLFDGTRPSPHYVDAILLDSSFGPGCFETAGTEFTYAVPGITDPKFSDPVFNTIRVRAIDSTGAVKYGEFTLVTNLVSDEVEISAYRYNIDDPGTPLDDSDAALRGETIYYHFDVTNKTAMALCGVQIRHYVRNSQGLLINGNPFIIPNSLITWSSGSDGQLNADPGPGNTAFGNISFLIDSSTPDPLHRIFEIYAPQDCTNPPFPEPFIDRAGVTTDISDIQVNTVISVFSTLDPTQALAFGYRTPGFQYQFNYSATNVGGPFRISSLQYCILNENGGCTNQNFPTTPPDFIGASFDFASFETRTDQSDIIGGASGLVGDEPTPLQILVTLEAVDQNSKSVTIRTLYSFPLLTTELPGRIIAGDDELVRGDAPVPYTYSFTNSTNGLLQNVKVFNLLETGPSASPGFYEEIGVAGFPAGTFYEVCQTHGNVINNGAINGQCNLTYHDGLPSGGFEMRVLVVGERASNGEKVISIGVLEISEIEHLIVEKIGPGIATTTSIVDWTITVENQSNYQHVDFASPAGFQDIVSPDPPAGSFTTPSLADAAWTGLVPQGGGIYRLPSNGIATYTPLRMTPPLPDGFGQTSFTNTVTMTGSTSPVTPDASFVSHQVSETAQNTVSFQCPIGLVGSFIDNPDPFANTNNAITVGETERVFLSYWNLSSTSTMTITSLTDAIFERENGRALTFNDIVWPGTPGVLGPGQFAYYETIITIRPIDFPNPEPTRQFTWNAFITLANAPSGCDAFDVDWYFEIVNPVLIDKQVRAGFDSIIFPGEEVRYQIAMQNRSEHAAMQVSALNDNILELDSSPLRMDFDNGAVYVPSGRLNPLGSTNGAILTEDGVQDSHIVTPTDPARLVNTATVHFYVINEPGNGPANMEKGPNFPMSNIDNATVSTANPLELIIVPSTYDAAAGSIIDVSLQVLNTSVDFSITNVVITSGDIELTSGLAAAGYVPPIASLAPANSQSFILTNPFYQIPTDYADATLSICAQATGTLQQAPPVDLEPVLRCATINIQPPDLEVVKEVFSENTCTIQLPDDDGDDIHEATIGARVYYGITLTNNSTTQTFANIAITDITNDGGNLTTLVQNAFVTGNGGSTSLVPGASVSICAEYQVTSTALGQPVLTNTVTVNATDAGVPLTVEDEVSVDVVDANIRISKRSLPIVGFPGSLIEYTITITNVNPDNNWLILDDVWDTLIADRLPGNPSYHDSCVAVSAPPNFAGCNPSITSIPFTDPNWTWPYATPGVIPPDVNQPAIYTYTYEIQDTDPDPLINTAGVMAHIYSLPNLGDPTVGPWTLVQDNQVPPQPIIAFDQTIASVAVTNSQLLVRKTATPTTALVGSTVLYNIGITNIGDRPVSNIRVFDCNPYTPCDTSQPFGTAGYGGRELTNSIVPLSARTSLPPFTPTAVINTYSLVMPVSADLQQGAACENCDPFINTVYAQGEVVISGTGTTGPTLPGSDTAIVDLIVPGLRVTKTPAVGSAGIGATVQYTIEIFNTGDQPLRINTVTDIVPGTGTWTPLLTMSPGACTNPATFAISPTSPDRLLPEESLCAVVSVVVENPVSGTAFTEFVNTVRVNATADPGGLNTTIVDSASAEIDVRNLGLTVTKLAFCIAGPLDPTCTSRHTITQVDEGKMYEYEITILNTSTTPLRELRISDPDLNGGAITQITDFTTVGDGSALFDPGESYTFIYTHTASILDDIGAGGGNAYTNIVTVSAIEEGGDLVQPRTASHTIVFVPAQVVVTKVGCIGTDTVPPNFSACVVATPFAQPGDFIWYQVTIVNPSNIAIDTITVTDSIEGVLNNTSNSGQAVSWPSVEGSLPGCTAPFVPPTCPEAVYVYRGSNPVTAADGSITNTAVVNGISGAANITANDSTTVYVTTSDLLVTIVEDNARNQATTGTVLNFTVTVTNIGTDTINNINVLLPFLSGTTPLVTPFDLTGGQSLVITPAPTYTVMNADTVMDFEVIANGLAVGTLPVSDTDLWSVNRVTPGLSVTKLADRSIARIGETITYTFIVENTSTTTAINNLVVSDPLVIFPVAWPPGLSPSQSVSQQVTYLVTGAEGNPITNTVTVTGTVAGSPISGVASVDVSVPNGDLLVENSPNVASASVGDTVSFTYRICNLSTTDDMTNVQLSDEGGALTLPSATLVANACFTVVRDITLTDFDVPELFRTATGSGTLPVGNLTQSVTSSVTVVPASAGDIRLEVQPSSAIAQIGGTLDLTFVITNVSAGTPLTITNFADATPWYTNFSINPIGEVLNPGEVLIFTGQTLAAGGTGGIPITITTPDPLTGTWTVTVEDPTNNVFSHDDSISVPVVNPGATLSVNVTSVPQNAVPGGTVTYTYRVQNLSAAVANNVTLNYLAQPVGNNCSVYTPGVEGLWTPAGVSIAPSGQAIATAVCEIDSGQAGGTTVDHTIEVLDGASAIQDTAVIQTPVSVPLGIEIIGSDPAIWRVESPVTITYRIYNASTATTVTNIVHSISNPTPCEDVQYFDAATGGNPVIFNGTLAPLAEVFVTCTHDPVEAQPTGQITVQANAEGIAEGSPVVATAEQIFDVVELGLTVQLTAAPDNGARTSVVDEGERINFTLVLENTGQTDLILPPATEDPVTSRVYNANTPTSVLGTLGDLYTYLENQCVWPLAPTDTCQIGFNDTFVTPPDLTFTPLAIHPSLMQATVEVMLWDALNNVPVMQTSTWAIEVQRPSITITSLTINPNTPMMGSEVIITAVIRNDGFSTLENVTAVANLSEVVAYAPQDGIILTSGHSQSSILNSVPMSVVDPVLVPGEQTNATLAWDVDRVGQFRLQVITSARNTVAGASLTTVQDDMEITFNSVADPSVATTDPDGNPLDPNALDPTVVKTAEPAAAFPNQDITFTVTITNGSTSDMGNISFVDAVPDAFTVVSASTTRGASIVSGQLITASTGQLAPGERVTLTIVTTVAPDVSIPSLWTNEACANVEDRDPVCASVEVGVGTDAAILPTTGFGEPSEQDNQLQKQLPVPEEVSEEPVAQGIPGAAGAIPLLGMGLLMLSASQPNRQRWMIGGAAIAIVGTMALGLLVLSGEDDDEGDDGSADAPTLTPTVILTGQPTATLQRRATAEATATLPPFDTPQVPENLPFPPTIRPSPTPYILPTASGPRRLEIPKLNLTRPVPIVELPQEDDTWDVSQLGHNVGWLEHTTWLDPTWGNTVIVGHVQLDSDDPGPFYYLGSLVVGDEIVIWEGDDRFVYEVSETETVHSTAIQVTYPTSDPILTLLTCTNWDFDRGVFADRLIIRAVPIERPTG